MFQFSKHIKIISGGQTGVDRAALDFALKNNITCGGWCPKGRIAEGGEIPEKYPLKETTTSEYSERTENNIIDSDATLIIYYKKIDPGTRLTRKLCTKYHKPLFNLNLSDDFKLPELMSWIQKNKIKVLNIAGPRESNSPGIYNTTLAFFESVYKHESNCNKK